MMSLHLHTHQKADYDDIIRVDDTLLQQQYDTSEDLKSLCMSNINMIVFYLKVGQTVISL